jgi:hypothetical protein
VENEKMKTSLEYTKLSKNWIFLLLQMVPTDFENKERMVPMVKVKQLIQPNMSLVVAP